jgi:GNAT superfamily N-acetyltransferase
MLLQPVDQHLVARDPQVAEHIANWAKNPDEGSEFATKNSTLRLVPAMDLIKHLFAAGYGAAVFFEDEQLVAHVFYQRHGSELRVFSVFVDEQRRGCGYAKEALHLFFLHARELGADAVQLGAGNHLAMTRVCEKLAAMPDLPYRVDTDNPTRFVRRS